MTILAHETHILIIPFPAQGHMIPLLDLTRHLASHGFTITILITPKNLPLLNPLLSTHPSIKTLILPFPSHPLIPFGIENVKDLPAHLSPLVMIRTLGELYDPLLNWFETHSSPPVAIISDMFLGWTHRLASRLNIRGIVFSPSGALALSVIYSLWRDLPQKPANDVVSFLGIPNCPKYPWWQISPLYRRYVEGDPDSEFVKNYFRDNFTSWGLVVNSLTELEGVYLDHLRRDLGHDRVWAVGPLLLTQDSVSDSGSKKINGPSSMPVHDVMTWLDKCEDHKVIYICFGSQTSLTNDQMKEIASSLEMSGVNFIWCVRKTEGQYNEIPSGFENRVADKGLVIRGWVPQISILSHRAIGSFLTHCGWNSILEALVAGVPMLAWPMGADQFSNATLLVDELGMAVRACGGVKTVPNSDDLAQALIESVSHIRDKRDRAKNISKLALDAMRDGGSSYKDLDKLVQNLIGLKEQADHILNSN